MRCECDVCDHTQIPAWAAILWFNWIQFQSPTDPSCGIHCTGRPELTFVCTRSAAKHDSVARLQNWVELWYLGLWENLLNRNVFPESSPEYELRGKHEICRALTASHNPHTIKTMTHQGRVFQKKQPSQVRVSLDFTEWKEVLTQLWLGGAQWRYCGWCWGSAHRPLGYRPQSSSGGVHNVNLVNLVMVMKLIHIKNTWFFVQKNLYFSPPQYTEYSAQLSPCFPLN